MSFEDEKDIAFSVMLLMFAEPKCVENLPGYVNGNVLSKWKPMPQCGW